MLLCIGKDCELYPNISSNSWRLTRVCLCLCVCVKGGVRNKMQKVDENKKKAGFMLRGLHISLFFFFFFQHSLCAFLVMQLLPPGVICKHSNVFHLPSAIRLGQSRRRKTNTSKLHPVFISFLLCHCFSYWK